ncbi:hypothetical protein [Olleya sp. HaHaR_3_96]|uniref:hypothetical protein n=1 Tax=Olleya sp. HaHaR_3_96 TaxID=2745560 RepID=UPI001C4FC499|nr:hypothetical protein [Olleya sp. HaHaR_3_96]QXP58333.1 hypothetical protein H0I26_10405 [Olleya sp. HaHaR_3_96]
MKALYSILVLFLIVSCSSSRVVDSWKSQDYANYKPKKVLIVGMTDNLTARKQFEEQLQTEFNKSGIEAMGSYDVFEPSFSNIKQTEASINQELERLSKDGYDSILISAVKGVNEKEVYSSPTYRTGYYWRRFGRYYYLYQDVYFDDGYYNRYKVYHIEASLYNIKENNDKSLVWVASYDIVDPKQINTTVTNYVKAIMQSLNQEGIINIKK